jgi:hypothetical protein
MVTVYPPSWRTLYALTFLPEETLEGLLRRGVISPELRRPQADTLIYVVGRYKNAENAAQDILAYRKKRESHEADAYLCRCSCGHVHPDQRVKRQLAELLEHITVKPASAVAPGRAIGRRREG